MKVYQYNEMMRYLTRKPTPVTSPEMLDTSGEQRETFAEGSKPKLNPIEKQNLIKEKETSILTKLNNQLAMGPAAIPDVGAEVINDVKGLYGKYAPQIAKGALTGLKVIGTPAVSAGLYAQDVYSDLKDAAKEGSVTASKALDTLVGQGEKGLFFMLPELAKDVVTNPIASKILQLGSIGRFATPFGVGLSAAGVAKDFYNQYKEFEALPQEQKELLRKQFTYDQSPEQTTAIENMGREGAATGGRINYAEGSDDELEIPILNESKSSYKKRRLGPEDPISKYESYSELELLENIDAKKPNYEIQEENMLYNMPVYEPKDIVPKESRPVMPNEYNRGLSDGILKLARGGRVKPKK
jgi:hypothetical protein